MEGCFTIEWYGRSFSSVDMTSPAWSDTDFLRRSTMHLEHRHTTNFLDQAGLMVSMQTPRKPRNEAPRHECPTHTAGCISHMAHASLPEGLSLQAVHLIAGLAKVPLTLATDRHRCPCNGPLPSLGLRITSPRQAHQKRSAAGRPLSCIRSPMGAKRYAQWAFLRPSASQVMVISLSVISVCHARRPRSC